MLKALATNEMLRSNRSEMQIGTARDMHLNYPHLQQVARMSTATCGIDRREISPGCRFAHPGHACLYAARSRPRHVMPRTTDAVAG
jgi:hypothetical protein